MRKTWKRALSLVLSAALVVTGGAFGALQNDKSAKAADAPWFTAFVGAFGNIWSWNNTDVGHAPAASVEALGVVDVDVSDYGVYTVKGTASHDTGVKGALVVNTTLTELPAGYTLVGKTVKVDDKEYNWPAEAYKDGDYIRLSVWNEWGDEKANTVPDLEEIKAGQVVQLTFEVVQKKIWFSAFLGAFGNIWSWNNTDVGHAPAASVEALGVVDVDVSDYGEYTVKGTASHDTGLSGALVVNTTLTELPQDYVLAGKTVKVDDKEYNWPAEAYKDGDYIRLSVWNEWGDEKANTVPDLEEIKAGQVVQLTFTVTQKGGTVTPPGGTTPGGNKPQTDTKKTLGLAKGKTFTSGNFKYKVTKAATITTVTKKTTKGTVSVVGLSKSGKKKSSISVGKTAKKSGATYNVTSVGSKAFKKAAKLKKATLGTNIKSVPTSAFDGCKKLTTVTAKGVTKIGKSAFKGCKALKKLVLKKKLSSVKKGAFKGCKKKIAVSGGSKKVKKANVKKLKKSGYKKFK